MSTTIHFEDASWLRFKLILATLSGRTLKIKNIRAHSLQPGLLAHEVELVRLVERITNGSMINLNKTRTTLFYQPGLLVGGDLGQVDCGRTRAISYFLEVILVLAPFCKTSVSLQLSGATDSLDEPSVDSIKRCSLPLLAEFLGTDEDLELKIERRGVFPEAGGLVSFRCPCRKQLRPVQLLKPGLVKRIRGISWALKVAPTTSNRMVESARSLLNQLVPDVYITTDHRYGVASGNSPGFGITLFAETNAGRFLTAELCSNPKGSDLGPSVPDELGVEAAKELLREVYLGGCVGTSQQYLPLILMAMTPTSVSKIVMGLPTPATISLLRLLKQFLGVIFNLTDFSSGHFEKAADSDRDDDSAETDGESEKKDNDSELNSEADSVEARVGAPKLVYTCVGVGYSNINKRTL